MAEEALHALALSDDAAAPPPPAGAPPPELPVPTLRAALSARPSPFLAGDGYHGGSFVSDAERVAVLQAQRGARGGRRSTDLPGPWAGKEVELPTEGLRAGPRETIYFNPATTRAAVVCTGGLVPGINDAIRAIALKLRDYGVEERNIIGIRHGLQGFYSKKRPPITLTRAAIESIQLEGGTILGSIETRELVDCRLVVRSLDLWKVDMLFVIGGPGAHAAILSIEKECARAGVLTALVCVAKSIDNDILLIDRTFGFETAVEEAQRALLTAKVEASSGYRGVGLVKLMGRRSGFIAIQSVLASGLVDVCVIPEVPWRLDALLAYVSKKLEEKGHAVVCVADGAARSLVGGSDNAARTLESGGADLGVWLRAELKRGLREVDVKYIDPSFSIRSVVATADDRVYARMLGHGAVHAAFAGLTAATVGLVGGHIAILPARAVIAAPRTVKVDGPLWNRLRSSIAQPPLDRPPPPGTP